MRVNITGFTAGHNGHVSRRGIAGLSNMLPLALDDAGFQVGYNEDERDVDVVFMNDLASPTVKYYERALKVLKENPRAFIAFEDWQIKTFYKTNDNYLKGSKVFKSHFHIKQDTLNQYRDVIEKINSGFYRVLYPAYITGDHSLLEIRGEKHYLDLSKYVIPEGRVGIEFIKMIPVHASLAFKNKWLESKKYTILNVRNESESDVYEYYQAYKLVLSPPHYHDGSGWQRNRYALANIAGAVIIEDENSPFGESYAVQRSDIESLNDLAQHYYVQNKAYEEVVATRDEVIAKLREVITR